MGGRPQKRLGARILATALLWYAALYAPHWSIPAAMGIICVFSFSDYYEILVAGFLIDVLFGGGIGWLYGFRYIFTLGALIVLLLGEMFKRQLRFNVFQD